ncbi:MAG: ABC transporter permease, partial [Caulobacteraceae bacterium]
MTDRSRVPLSLRFAARALRRGVRGFGVFLACLALGVGAIAAAGSTAAAFREGLAREAGAILGGDLAVGVEQREFTPVERAGLERLGRVDYAAASRAMAASPSGARRLVVLRGVSADYPLIGQVTLAGGVRLADALGPEGGAAGVAVEPALLERLGLKLGEPFTIGDTRVVARAILLDEPDRLSRGFALGLRVLAPIAVLRKGGFLAPGMAFGETARIALRPGLTLAAAKRAITQMLPRNSYVVRDRADAAPGYERLIDRLEYFLGLIGLASLAAGGLGVWSAVDAYLEGEKPAIAVLKALGADGALVRNLYLAEVSALAALGVVIGLTAGAATPFVLGALLPRDFPAPALFAVYPAPLAKAAVFGLLAAAAFSLAPLGAARATPAALLLRQEMSRRPPLGPELAGALLAGAGLVAMAVLTAPDPLTAAALIGGVAAGFAG